MDLQEIIKNEFERRILLESYSRIETCLNELSDEELWKRPNNNLVSVANLILHLEGNVKQWILSAIGNEPDDRQRDNEFNQTDRIDRLDMMISLKETILQAVDTIDSLKNEEFSKMRSVQGFDESVASIIIHVIEHFSYHTGQITYYTKYIKNIDTQYYGDLDLNQKS